MSVRISHLLGLFLSISLLFIITGCDTAKVGSKQHLVESTSIIVSISAPLEVTAGDTVSVGASVSFTDGSNPASLNYAWSQTAGDNVSYAIENNGQSIKFTAADVSSDQSVTFKLQADDGNRFATTEQSITIRPDGISFHPNIGARGSQQGLGSGRDGSIVYTVAAGDVVHMHTKAVSRAGSGVTYQWQQLSGTSVTLSNSSDLNPSFTAPNELETLRFQVTATGPDGKSTSQFQTVNVIRTHTFSSEQGDKHQVFNGHGDIILKAQVNVPDALKPVTFKWQQIEPVTPIAPLSATDTQNVTATLPNVNSQTTFKWEVVATDARGHESISYHTVEVLPDNALSVTFVDAADKNVFEGDVLTPSVQVTGGSGTYKYAWTTSLGSITDASKAAAQIKLPQIDQAQDITVSVTVDDGAQPAVVRSRSYTLQPRFKLTPHNGQANTGGVPSLPVTGSSNHVEAGKLIHPALDVHDNAASGGTYTYLWEIIEPSTVPAGLTLAGATTSVPILSTPLVTTDTVVKLRATITYTAHDGRVFTKRKELSYTILAISAPSVPTLSIQTATHQLVFAEHKLGLHVTVLGVAPGSTLTYDWKQKSGPSISIGDANTATPTVTTPIVSSKQEVVLEVTVGDGTNSVKQTVTIDIEPFAHPPLIPVSVSTANTAAGVVGTSHTLGATVQHTKGRDL